MRLIKEFAPKKFSRMLRLSLFLLAIGSILVITSFAKPLGANWETSNYIEYLRVMGIAGIITIVLHEALHGLFFKHFTGKVRFGVKFKGSMGPCAYASSPGSLIPRNKFLVIGLAPQILTIAAFIVLTSATLPTKIAFGILAAAALNVGGACIDFFSCSTLLRYPKNILIEDNIENVKIYAPE